MELQAELNIQVDSTELDNAIEKVARLNELRISS